MLGLIPKVGTTRRAENWIARTGNRRQRKDAQRAEVDLIVLSGCETGASEVDVAAENFGFLRGLMSAGAQTIVLTHWAVDDQSTAKLFSAFYHYYGTNSAAEALRLAALETSKVKSHPFFWAAPTTYGWWRG